MRKYPAGERIVGAIYDNAPADNPFLAALPEMLSQKDFISEIRNFPKLPANLSTMTSEERRQALPLLSSIFVPLDYMYALYDQMYRAIRSTYSTRTILEEIRQTNALFRGSALNDYSTQAVTGSILGIPGAGKSSTIRRSLATMPQVIEHQEYMGRSFYCKQVLYLCIECPSDCSVKAMAFNLVAALDQAIGSDYLHQLTSLRSVATSAIATQIKILCMSHHVGLLVVDEIQNAVETAQKNRQVKPLLKFLVELTNDTSTAIYFVGTPLAEQLFVSQEHLRRRTRGVRLLPLKPDGTYRAFLEQLWPYQLTPKSAQLTDKLANKLYDHSAGIPAYITKIFMESQVQALLMGSACINEKMIQRAVDILAIRIPKFFSGGTSISAFRFEQADVPLIEGGTMSLAEQVAVSLPRDDDVREVPRSFANKRGRPVTERDSADLLVVFRARGDVLKHLQEHDLLEVSPSC